MLARNLCPPLNFQFGKSSLLSPKRKRSKKLFTPTRRPDEAPNCCPFPDPHDTKPHCHSRGAPTCIAVHPRESSENKVTPTRLISNPSEKWMICVPPPAESFYHPGGIFHALGVQPSQILEVRIPPRLNVAFLIEWGAP